MTVYVDRLRPCVSNRKWRWKEAAHLFVEEDLEALHSFAHSLGLKMSWYQSKSMPHYDLTRGMYFKALKMGAVEVSDERMVEVLRGWRARRAEKKKQGQTTGGLK